MKFFVYILFLFSCLLFLEGCDKTNVYEQRGKTLDSLSGAVNAMVKNLERVDTITLEKSISRFGWYKDFISENITDTITKAEADNLQLFYKSGANLENFSFNRKTLLMRATLINSQLKKLALDIQSKSLSEAKITEYTRNEKSEASRLIEAAYHQQKLFYSGQEEFKNALHGVELLIRSRNNGELPAIIKDTVTL